MEWVYILVFNYVTIFLVLLITIIKEKSGRNKFVDILHCLWISIVFSLLPFMIVIFSIYNHNKANEYKKWWREELEVSNE